MGGGEINRRAVFLDRDGVIDRALIREGKPYPPGTMDELELLPGVKEALHTLHQAGFLLVVVTNQPDVARGKQRQGFVEAVHRALLAQLPLDEIRVCYHSDEDGCACRKPRPGMLLDAARLHEIDLARSYMVGDRWRDVQAGRDAGCKTVLIDYGYAEERVAADFTVYSLEQAAFLIMQRKETEE